MFILVLLKAFYFYWTFILCFFQMWQVWYSNNLTYHQVLQSQLSMKKIEADLALQVETSMWVKLLSMKLQQVQKWRKTWKTTTVEIV